jgi:hypothetical protein
MLGFEMPGKVGFERLFYGAPALRGRWKDWTLKGSLVRSRRRYLAQHAPGAIETIRAALDAEGRHYLDGDVLVSERMPVGPLVALDEQIVLHAMDGDVSRMQSFGREIASFDLEGGLYRGMLRAVGGSISLRVYAIAYQSYFQPGSIETVHSDERSTTLALRGVVLPRYMCTHGFTGYIERLLELAGATRRVTHDCAHEGADVCSWRVDVI